MMSVRIIKIRFKISFLITLFIIIGISLCGCAMIHYERPLKKDEPYAEIIVMDPTGSFPHIEGIVLEGSGGYKASSDFGSVVCKSRRAKFRVPAGSITLQINYFTSSYVGQDYTGHSFIYKYSKRTWSESIYANVEAGKLYFLLTNVEPGRLLREDEYKKVSFKRRSLLLNELF